MVKVMLFTLAFFTIGVSIHNVDGASQVDLVAPGIWKIRFGNPETFTPTYFRITAMNVPGLNGFPTSFTCHCTPCKIISNA